MQHMYNTTRSSLHLVIFKDNMPSKLDCYLIVLHFVFLRIDCCIGSKNTRAFLFSLIFLILSTYYGALLTLTTICEPLLVFDFFLVPHDCTGIYDNIQ